MQAVVGTALCASRLHVSIPLLLHMPLFTHVLLLALAMSTVRHAVLVHHGLLYADSCMHAGMLRAPGLIILFAPKPKFTTFFCRCISFAFFVKSHKILNITIMMHFNLL